MSSFPLKLKLKEILLFFAFFDISDYLILLLKAFFD